MRVRIYLKSGQVIKLRGVSDMTYTRTRIAWKCHGHWLLHHCDPDEVVAIVYSSRRWWLLWLR